MNDTDLHERIVRACKDLPEGYMLRLCLAHNEIWVELCGDAVVERDATGPERELATALLDLISSGLNTPEEDHASP